MTEIRTRFTERFGLRHPVASAPMALVAGGALARAVSAAGGLGLVGGGYAGAMSGPDLDQQLDLAKGERFGVGFILWALERDDAYLDRALSHGPDCVFLSFGDPAPYERRIRAAGARLICQAQTLRHVHAALDAGADAVVVQGGEAGGHGGSRALFPFLPEAGDLIARRAPETVLLAAGGVADGRGLAAALMLGADGVVVGTRFWASAEALTPRAATDLATGASGDDTTRTTAVDALRGAPWPAEYSLRLLKNDLTEAWAGREAEARERFGALKADYDAARAREDFKLAAVIAGEAVGLVHDRPPAGDILRAMTAEAAARLARGGGGDFRR
jgi:nitronate monooxygenase